MTEINHKQVVDSDARVAALDAERSFIVQAPAGSGKTELLTQRFLKMLAQVDQPEELLAITFTRKAAAEMRSRIINAIYPPPYTGESGNSDKRLPETIQLANDVQRRDRELDWQLKTYPARLRIRTIDSVNAWLSSTAPLATTVTPAQVVDVPTELYREAAHQILELAASDETVGVLVRKLLMHLDNRSDTFVRLLTRMLARREQWLGFVVNIETASRNSDRARQELEACLYDLVALELEAASAHLNKAQQQDLVALLNFAANNQLTIDPDSDWSAWAQRQDFPEPVPAELRHWQLLAEFLLTKGGSFRKRLTVKEGFPPGQGKDKALNQQLKERALACIQSIEESHPAADVFSLLPQLPEPAYTDTQWEMLQCLLQVLQHAAAELELVFAETGQADYPAVAQAAIDALGDDEDAPTDLALRLDYSIRHILIDEFQDTSSAQLRLLSALTAGWQAGDGRSLFIVGDPMQSIYRFRQAEVGLFLELQRDGLPNIELEAITLQTNFRSDPKVMDWVNRVFSRVMPAASELTRGAVGYAPGAAIRKPDSAATVELHPLVAPARHDEAEQIVTLVRSTLNQHPEQDIGILVRNKAHANLIADALRREGIHFSGAGLENTLTTSVVQDLLGLTRALCHLADRTAWLGILRAPWCGLGLADLEALAGPDIHCCIWDLLNEPEAFGRLSPDGQHRAKRVRDILTPIFEQRGSLSLRDLVEGVWLQLGGPALLGEPVDLERASSLFAALEKVDAGGDCADGFFLHERIAEHLSVEDSDAGVYLLTIHKAKGLEFDTVILPALEAGTRGDDKPVLAWQEIVRPSGRQGLIIAPIEATGDSGDAIFELARRQQKIRAEFETDRLLYVAATRARVRLHLFFGLSLDTEGVAKQPARHTLLGRLWPAIADDHADFSGSPGHEAKPDAWLEPSLRRYKAGWKPPPPPRAFNPFNAEPAAAEPRAVSYDWASSDAMHIGTAVHRWLQFLAENNCVDWTDTELNARLPVYRMMLAELGVAERGLDASAQTVLTALNNAIQHERGRWLLFASHNDATCELQLNAQRSGRIDKIIIDRSFVTADDERWIVDYKTSSHAGGNLDGFIASEVERYSPQLMDYAEIFGMLEPGRKIRTALYFPLLGVLEEIDLHKQHQTD